MLVAMVVIIEIADLVFAVDSVSAVLTITTDPFILITSNIFAILGLRSLYFLLAGTVDNFYYLKPALALTLFLIGSNALLSQFRDSYCNISYWNGCNYHYSNNIFYQNITTQK